MSFGLGQIGGAGRLGRPRLNGGVQPPAWVIDPSVSLDIDFMNDRSWFGGAEGSAFGRLSANRNAQASYYDVNGILQFAPTSVPRIDYHPTTHAKLGFLAEQAIAQYCRFSNDFTNAAWTKTNVTLTPATIIGPDGLMSATKAEATTAGATLLYNSCGGAGTPLGNTGSIFAKKGSGATDANRFILRNETTATDLAIATIDYDTGALTLTTGTGAVTPLVNGWYRIELSALTGISAGDNLRIYAGFSGSPENAGEFAYFYGGQMERVSSATSYFPNPGGTVPTRFADRFDLATNVFAYTQSAGTLLGRFKCFQAGFPAGAVCAVAGFFVDLDTTYAERISLHSYAATPNYRVGSNGRAGNVNQWDMQVNSPRDTFTKAAVAWQLNDVAVLASGGAPVTDNTAVMPTTPNRMGIGRALYDTWVLNGHIDRVTYWPYRKSNAQLMALTA